MTAVIEACALGKRYRIGEREQYLALRDKLANLVRLPVRAMKRATRARKRVLEEIWALQDVNFEVQPGEIVGLIGRNGAGKSTLLKILSRVTRPTTGWAEVRGRMGTLLEVGTGFHPELTGRENVFLNGAILGMSKREIERKFDEIVAFAEVEKFIDTSVKHYSSGMTVRLAFAVAAHLEPEILLIDEVLAVGDAAFQKKCLGKMGQVSREGRTILFVSHNMAAVKALCSRAILVREGSIAASGKVSEVVDDYLLGASAGANIAEWQDPAAAPGNHNVRMRYVRAIPPQAHSNITIDSGFVIEIGFDNLLAGINLDCTIYLNTGDGVVLFEAGHPISSDRDSRCGFHRLGATIPPHLLNAGRYSVDVLFGRDQRYPLFRIDGVVSLEIENTTTGRGSNMTVAPGVIRPLLSWRLAFEEECVPLKETL